MWASSANQYEIIKILQKYGGDINQATDLGNALHQSCARDHIETVDYLLE